MLRSLRPIFFFALTVAACSSSKTNDIPYDGGTSGGGGTASNAWFCSDPAPAGCTGVAVCGTCVPSPASDLRRTTDAKEYSDKAGGAVDLACFDKANPPASPGDSKPVKLKGIVKIFANGPDSKNVKIEIYEEKLEGGKQTGQLGNLVATGFSSDTTTVTETITKSGTMITRTLYGYEIDGVPTAKPLVVKTSGKTDADGWFPLYDWNIVIENSLVKDSVYDCQTGDVWRDGRNCFSPKALGNDDYVSILKAAYNRLPNPGEAALAGEVHDCGDYRVSGATAEISPKSALPLFYLSEVEDDPLPDGARKSTGRLGLYAVGGLKAQTYTVASAGKIGSTLVTLGTYKVQTFADSVSVYSFRGLRPWALH